LIQLQGTASKIVFKFQAQRSRRPKRSTVCDKRQLLATLWKTGLAHLHNRSACPPVGSVSGTHYPQEIIDIILDAVNDDISPTSREAALMACALVARSFAHRSQMHLFSVVHLDRATQPRRLYRFHRLLKSSRLKARFAPLVKQLCICHPTNNRGLLILARICRIVRSLPSLERLSIAPLYWSPYPEWLAAAVSTALARPSLRSFELQKTRFADAAELDAFLAMGSGQRGGVALKDLGLADVWILKHGSGVARRPGSLVLESLALTNMRMSDVRNFVKYADTGSGAVDVSHLRRLVLTWMHVDAFELLLERNAHSLEEIHLQNLLATHYSMLQISSTACLLQTSPLRSISIYARGVRHMLYQLRLFGDLHKLKRLTTISLVLFFNHRTKPVHNVNGKNHHDSSYWKLFDKFLARAGGGVTVYIGIQRTRMEKSSASLSTVTAKLRRRIHSFKGEVVVEVVDVVCPNYKS
ncbi:hypothetical protein GGX14DRAFT_427257, partial [Mycena pura]